MCERKREHLYILQGGVTTHTHPSLHIYLRRYAIYIHSVYLTGRGAAIHTGGGSVLSPSTPLNTHARFARFLARVWGRVFGAIRL